ncbi:MAG: hypothetical protein M1839_001936 [Geoglossum umbratile]|nr:MAG: hypothetical protein M1839_001936 [Geoglossum umbratile]
MAPDSVVSRLQYLNDAAHLLLVESPAVSAHLLSQCNKIAFENELDPSSARKRSVCGACGSIMVPGWTCHVHPQSAGSKKVSKKTLKRRRSRKPQMAAPSSVSIVDGTEMGELEMVYQCRACGRATRQALPKKPPRRPAVPLPPTANTSIPTQHLGLDAAESAGPATANASSKKRAKARKQGGLQALLAKRQRGDELSGDFGLDLMDLMKKT